MKVLQLTLIEFDSSSKQGKELVYEKGSGPGWIPAHHIMCVKQTPFGTFLMMGFDVQGKERGLFVKEPAEQVAREMKNA